jgi:DNA polymerase I
LISNYLVLDIENNSSKRYKRNAGNFLYDEVVAIGLKYFDYGLNEQDTGRLCGGPWVFDYKSFLLKMRYQYLNWVEVLAGHNIKHDLLFLWKNEMLQEYLKKGGKVWDTQLAEYFLTSFETNTKQKEKASLRYLAVNKYGCKERQKLMEEYWDKGVQTSDIPKELVLEDVKNDVLDTEQIYLRQVEKAKQLGILDVIEFNMDYLLATTEMEFQGFFTDLETLRTNKEELQKQLFPIRNEFEQIVNKYIPIEVFNNQPKKGLHALFFGGEIKVVEKVLLLDANGLPVMFKTGQKIGHEKYKNQEKVLKINGLGIKPLGHWVTEKGNVSIDEGVLKEIISAFPEEIKKTGGWTIEQQDALCICKRLLEIRRIEKEISTYYDAIEELVYDIDQCVHAKYHHTRTDTGRLSSSDPNLQNIPRGKGDSRVKEQFRSRY